MRQLCNLAYHMLAEGRSAAQIAELETMLADPSERDDAIARQNAEAMAALSGFGIAPPPRRPRK